MADDLLVVDDNDLNREYLVFVLASDGHQVRSVDTAEAALAEISRAPPRLLLTDVRMPGMGGLELTRRLKADPATRAIIVLVVTAEAMGGDAERALAAGADGHVTKPVDRVAIRKLVREHLQREPMIAPPGKPV